MTLSFKDFEEILFEKQFSSSSLIAWDMWLLTSYWFRENIICIIYVVYSVSYVEKARLTCENLNLDNIYHISFDEMLLWRAALKYAKKSCMTMTFFIL